jgi:hypothetical protein
MAWTEPRRAVETVRRFNLTHRATFRWFFPLLRYSISSPGFSLSSLLLSPSCIIAPLLPPVLSPLYTLHTPSFSCLPSPCGLSFDSLSFMRLSLSSPTPSPLPATSFFFHGLIVCRFSFPALSLLPGTPPRAFSSSLSSLHPLCVP